MSLQSIIKTVGNFLFSKVNRELLTFLFFFAVAGIFWLLMTLNETYEQEVRVPIHYANVPKTAMLTSPETDTIRITVSDKGITLLTYLYGDVLKNISIDFSQHAKQGGKGEITATEISKLITPKLSASTKLVSVKPERLTFYYNFGEKKRVPVIYKGHVKPDALYYISAVTYDPDSVTIYAPHSKLDSITYISTEELNYTNFRDTLSVKANIQKAPGVKIVPDVVNIKFMTDILTEESIEGVPVEGINMPEGKVLRLFPAKVTVNFVAGVKTYKKLSAKDFQVVADYNEIKDNPSQQCNIYLRKVPAGISKASLSKKQLDYLIEDIDR